MYAEAAALVTELPQKADPAWTDKLQQLLDYNMSRGN
jgi:hypothetical protein